MPIKTCVRVIVLILVAAKFKEFEGHCTITAYEY